jgi:hypothetical protein
MSSMMPDTPLVVSLPGVAYDFYCQVRRAPGNQHLRMTYDDEILGIIITLYKYDIDSRRIGLIMLAVTAVLGIPCRGTVSATFCRRGPQLSRGWGKEPDQGVYLENQSRICG